MMKLLAMLSFTLAVVAATAPSQHVKRAINCDDCKHRLQFCVDNGGAPGISRCADTCAQHVCYQTPGCRGCGGDFGRACPDVSRYHRGCGDRQC